MLYAAMVINALCINLYPASIFLSRKCYMLFMSAAYSILIIILCICVFTQNFFPKTVIKIYLVG